ncbi:MAG: Flp pilus assembly protein CpaB [Candidatus Thermofonsia Clade 1 bacterium]|uniref:Flp pilus assembly protein CpaB n=1 Tax=Candidatus Thermofonsia Clade 1 bacterium TaxID=2364210 RepID=A0A2M8Q0P1_9CHLR|nr:MAG: Flp pilus assembly protein CpaB [Candidatus Thermofonsia Clade 1 bacterium]PJF43376.1 MAG: Flp pilus assembly protein CpaB [Candidatus Thermofonsia Clade 1 bacterium]
MSRTAMILVLLVVILGGGAAVLLLTQNQSPQPQPDQPIAAQEPQFTPIPPVEFVEIVIALQELPRGIVIPEDGVGLRPWPKESLPINSIDSVRDVVGRIARTDIVRESPVLSTQLVDNISQIASAGSDAAAVLPNGLVAVAMPIDRLTNVAHAPMSGDTVDIIISFLFVDVDDQFQTRLPNKITLTVLKQDGTLEFQSGIEGRIEPSGDFPFPIVVGPSEIQRPRLVTQRTIQNALVIHVGTFPPDGDFLNRRPTPPPPPTYDPARGGPTPLPTPTFTPLPPKDIITLAMEPQEAVALVWAIESRLPITLALRSARDRNAPPTSTNAVSLEYMITEYRVPQPAALPYSLEPAIRSIRRLILSDEVTLSTQDR